MRILNLGAGGFIGSHLTERLLKEKHSVVAVDIHSDKIRELLNHCELTFIEGDIRHPDFQLDKLVKESDLVIDLIAHANPSIYVKSPLEVFRLNFNENLKIAEACVYHKKRLIQFSSCEVYGKTVASFFSDHLTDPEDSVFARFSEDHTNFILGPVKKHRWIYSAAKQLLERVLHAYGLEGQLNYTIIRPFNFIGPKIDYLPDENDGSPRVFSHFMEALLEQKPMKLVDGGAQRRCYTAIEDAIECTYRIIENHGGVCNCEIFNIGSPENEVSIRSLAKLMRKIYHNSYDVPNHTLPEIIEVSGDEFYGKGYEDSDRRIPDITKARTILGWEPECGLEKLLEITMKYYRDIYLENSN